MAPMTQFSAHRFPITPSSQFQIQPRSNYNYVRNTKLFVVALARSDVWHQAPIRNQLQRLIRPQKWVGAFGV